jgi:hypothetical protein
MGNLEWRMRNGERCSEPGGSRMPSNDIDPTFRQGSKSRPGRTRTLRGKPEEVCARWRGRSAAYGKTRSGTWTRWTIAGTVDDCYCQDKVQKESITQLHPSGPAVCSSNRSARVLRGRIRLRERTAAIGPACRAGTSGHKKRALLRALETCLRRSAVTRNVPAPPLTMRR